MIPVGIGPFPHFIPEKGYSLADGFPHLPVSFGKTRGLSERQSNKIAKNEHLDCESLNL